MSASLLLWQCQSSVSRASSPCLSWETIPESCPNRHWELGQPSLPPYSWHCHQRGARPPATLPPGSTGTGHPSCPIQAFSPWQWRMCPPLRTPHIWDMEGTQEPWLPAPAPSCSSVGATAGSPQSHCVKQNWPHVKHTGAPNLCPKTSPGSPMPAATLWEYWPSSRQGERQAGSRQQTHEAIIPYLSRGKEGADCILQAQVHQCW